MKTDQTRMTSPNTLNEWQIREIKRALAEADRGDFASDEEVNLALSKWSRPAQSKPRS
jgi:predicted transcriptional regulator